MEQLTIENLINDNNNLDKLLADYFELKAKKDALDAELKTKNKAIVEAIEKLGETSYSSNDYKASISYKTTFKYKDEFALIDYLKKEDFTQFVVEAIDTKNFNDYVKKNPKFKELVADVLEESISPSLSVKKI